MKRLLKLLSKLVALVTLLTGITFAQTKYVITNDDTFPTNTASIYSVGSGGALSLVTTIPTGGEGNSGGYFGTPRVNVLRSKTHNCVYVGDALGGKYDNTGDVAAIDMSTLTLAGRFPGFYHDDGSYLGVGLAEDPSSAFLFAAYTYSSTITTYKQLSGCKLKRLSEIITVGLFRGAVDGIKVTPNGKFVILAYGDGTIGSYKINATTGELTLINRYYVADGEAASGLDITSDSRWVLFGDSDLNGVPVVEVAPIHSDGSLGQTKDYAGIGTGASSQDVWLSPDESLVYISNNSSGQITAAPFDKNSGAINIAKACTSAVLKNFNSTWKYLGAVVSGSTAGTGSPLYAGEWSAIQASGIAIVDVKKPCTLTETPASPAVDPASDFLLNVGVDPPRSF
jgi:hypothetical protein